MYTKNSLISGAFNKFLGRELDEEEMLLDILWSQPNNGTALKDYLNSFERIKKFAIVLFSHEKSILPELLNHIELILASSPPGAYLELIDRVFPLGTKLNDNFTQWFNFSPNFFRNHVLIDGTSYHFLFERYHAFFISNPNFFESLLEKIGMPHIEQTCTDFRLILCCSYDQKKIYHLFSEEFIRQWAIRVFSDVTKIFSQDTDGGHLLRKNKYPLSDLDDQVAKLICGLLSDEFISLVLAQIPLRDALLQNWMEAFVKAVGPDRFMNAISKKGCNPIHELISAALDMPSYETRHYSVFYSLCISISKEKFDCYIDSNEETNLDRIFKLINSLEPEAYFQYKSSSLDDDISQVLINLLGKERALARHIHNMFLHGLTSKDPGKILLLESRLPDITLAEDDVDSVLCKHTIKVVQPAYKRMLLDRDSVHNIAAILRKIPELRRCEILALFEQRYDFYAYFRNHFKDYLTIKSLLPKDDHQQDGFEQKYGFSMRNELALLATSFFSGGKTQHSDAVRQSPGDEHKNNACVIS
ncbi:TPA: hypothetical protein ACUY58_002489 [Legionella pneumophila]